MRAAALGTRAVVPRFGGFLGTVREDVTGVFFEETTLVAVAGAVAQMLANQPAAGFVRDHVAR